MKTSMFDKDEDAIEFLNEAERMLNVIEATGAPDEPVDLQTLKYLCEREIVTFKKQERSWETTENAIYFRAFLSETRK